MDRDRRPVVEHDDTGNQILILTVAGTESHTFDRLTRLTEVDDPNRYVVTYTYDANDNRLTQTATYDDVDQLTDLNGTSYTYDANGNLAAAGADPYRWGWTNQLSTAIIDGITLITSGSPLQKLGGGAELIFTAVACALDAPCRTLAARFGQAVDTYGSSSQAGPWTLGAQATRLAFQHFPDLPTRFLCTLATAGAVYGVVRGIPTSVELGGTGNGGVGPGSGMGCASGGSSGGSGDGSGGRGSKPIDTWVKSVEDAVGSQKLQPTQAVFTNSGMERLLD